ncbi:hypothetical protein Forpi1262_v007057 [Fusarium oxysporum f. sp. raphani]|uniref:Uncharacterized protein n=1 Tax=Fusarium oxysporum f. sp. raphani TaxID=96318 RepID=A0A8J5Q231_FUSOX|nr:hypothetical protein Forpi1262_v007057 [Fusarium oxysporum f. sp. raphani]
MESIFRTYDPTKQSFNHHNAPLFVALSLPLPATSTQTYLYTGSKRKLSCINKHRLISKAEIAHLNYLLVAHGDCCGASQVCTHSVHLGPPQNTATCNIAKDRIIPQVPDSSGKIE